MSCTLHVPTQINELITNLSIIALINKDQKLNIKTMSFSPSNTWGQSLYRAWYQESRVNLMAFLKVILEQTLLAMEDYKDTKFLKIIINHLKLSRTGINNLLQTYADDPNIVAQLQVILENIDIQLDKNKQLVIPDFQASVIIDGQFCQDNKPKDHNVDDIAPLKGVKVDN